MKMEPSPKYRALFIFFFICAVLFLIIAGTLPIIIEKKIIQTKFAKSKPHSNNVGIWGSFPGELETELKHTFTFFNYPEKLEDLKEGEELPLSDKSIIFTEKVKYQNFTFDDKVDHISFDAKREYILDSPVAGQHPVNLPSMGMLELFQTLSKPPAYQQGIVSIAFVLDQALGSKEDFHKQLLMLYYYDSFFGDDEGRGDRVKRSILGHLSEEKRNKIFNHPKYGLDKYSTFFKWMSLIDDEEAQQEATWLKGEFDLTDEEITKIIGKNSYLQKFIKYYNDRLIEEFNCNKDAGCQLLYQQLSDGNVLDRYGIADLAALKKMVRPDAYSFLSPEMNIFYEKEYKDKGKSFEELKLLETHLNLLLDKSSNLRLNDPINLITLLNMNTTSDSYRAYELYKISSLNQLNFITDYVFKYLPKIYINTQFEHQGQNYVISGLSKAYSSLLSMLIDKTAEPLIQKQSDLHVLTLSKYVYGEILKLQDEDYCASILQRILDDGRKVRNLCSNPKFDFGQEEGLKTWLIHYMCFYVSDSYCNETIYQDFLEETVLSDEQVKAVFNEDGMGKQISEANSKLSSLCNCASAICTGLELAKAQYGASKITRFPPEGVEAADSISVWDKETFNDIQELYVIQKENNFSLEEVSDEIKMALTTFYNSSFNLLDEKYSDALSNKFKIEQIRTLFENGITSSQYSEEYNVKDIKRFSEFIDIMLDKFILTQEFITNYKPMSIINGNNEEDKLYIDILKSGPFYSNFKPGLEKTTGFDLKIVNNSKSKVTEEEEEEEKEELNSFTILTSRSDSSKLMRQIVEMNGQPIYSLKKSEYSPLKEKFITVAAPLYDSSRLDDEDHSVYDGFQFPIEDQDSLYYFDEISARKFQFKNGDRRKYGKLKCKEYKLNKDDLVQSLKELDEPESKIFPYSSQKFNKPMIITTPDKEFYYKINVDSSKNFMCVDEYTDFVLESKMTMVYAIDTKGFQYLNHKILDDKKFPICVYKREYKVLENSYNDVFNGVQAFYGAKIAIIVFGTILAVIFIVVGIISFIKYRSHKYERVSEFSAKGDTNLIPPDMRQTIESNN